MSDLPIRSRLSHSTPAFDSCPRCKRPVCPVVWTRPVQDTDGSTCIVAPGPTGPISVTDETTGEAYKLACRAIGEVVALERFNNHHGDPGRPHNWTRATGRLDGWDAADMLSVRTLAMFRAFRRLTFDPAGTVKAPIADRFRAADEVASELAHYLAIDMDIAIGSRQKADRAIDDAIGDLCPGCRQPMTAEDGPALRDDYRCAKCLEKGEVP